MIAGNPISEALFAIQNPERAKSSLRFFKTGPGEYGEGDRFYGIPVPVQREIVKAHWKTLTIEHLRELLRSPIHEERLSGVFALVHHYKATKPKANREKWVNFYLSEIHFINNWDLVDSSCHLILGDWLLDKDRSVLYELAQTDHLWSQRIAIVSTIAFIRKGQFEDTLQLSIALMNHKHDLIHKAIGWMLREIGQRDLRTELAFLDQYATNLPRTALRYAIEKFPESMRKEYLNQR